MSIAPTARPSSRIPGRCIQMRFKLDGPPAAELHAEFHVNDPDRCFSSACASAPGTASRKSRLAEALKALGYAIDGITKRA